MSSVLYDPSYSAMGLSKRVESSANNAFSTSPSANDLKSSADENMKQSGTNTFRVLLKRSRHIRQAAARSRLAAPPTQSVRDDPSFESARTTSTSERIKKTSIQVKRGARLGGGGIENNKRVMLGFFLPLPGLCMWDIRHSSFLKRSAREQRVSRWCIYARTNKATYRGPSSDAAARALNFHPVFTFHFSKPK